MDLDRSACVLRPAEGANFGPLGAARAFCSPICPLYDKQGHKRRQPRGRGGNPFNLPSQAQVLWEEKRIRRAVLKGHLVVILRFFC